MTQSIIPPTGDFSGNSWASTFNLPQGLSGQISAGGWTFGNEGYVQQTFLGGSIINWNANGGFGDTVSNLSVQIVNDEHNRSDRTGLGLGDDVYHNGNHDLFSPPQVGTPVFFKFGKTHATIEQAWRKTFDDLYNYNTFPGGSGDYPRNTYSRIESAPPYNYLDLATSTLPTNLEFVDETALYAGSDRGKFHFVFGGILQSSTQNKGTEGNPLYSVQVVDPREILSNCQIILRNYAGSTFNYKNYFNVFGFLEHDVSDSLREEIDSVKQPGFIPINKFESADNWITSLPFPGTKHDNALEKLIDPSGYSYYYGNDMYRFTPTIGAVTGGNVSSYYPEFFPMTGQGFARVCEQGIPWYRVRQALTALFNFNGVLPQEFIDAGYGGPINFRGYNYVVDFSGIPLDKIPQMYFLDFEQLDMLSLAQELCDIISHSMFITLLPVIDHPACQFLFDQNQYWIEQALTFPEGSIDRNLALGKVVTGIIRIDAIDRSQAPSPGVIKRYLETMQLAGVEVENQDLGYELSNVTTDKIVVGGQEVGMYYFTNNKDRDHLQVRRLTNGLSNQAEFLMSEQWSLSNSLKQQILPFYGFLGKDAVTIPRGFGSYQQIMLDASSINAYGVGNYYVTTEIELRHALVSYQRWKEFLVGYNDIYVQEVGEYQQVLENLSTTIPMPDDYDPENQPVDWLNREFAVSAPRCVFNSDREYMGVDDLPASPCAPPFGYPLYYKRAEKIGIPEAGFTDLITKSSRLISEANDALTDIDNQISFARDEISRLNNEIRVQQGENADMEGFEQEKKQQRDFLKSLQEERNKKVAFIAEFESDEFKTAYRTIQKAAVKSERNAKKVYEFVREIAEKHLGKTFLIKIPKACNVNYSPNLQLWNPTDQTFNFKYGPFGFRPRPVVSNVEYYSANQIATDQRIMALQGQISEDNLYEDYIWNEHGESFTEGALKCNFNPITEKWDYNYEPAPQGGFFDFDLYNNHINFFEFNNLSLERNNLPPATMQMLAPIDMTNLIGDNNRVQCYARFDNSQFMDFTNIPKQSIVQQVYTPAGFIPDILQILPNVSNEEKDSFQDIDDFNDIENTLRRKPKSVAYLKCDVDTGLYMPPQMLVKQSQVFAREVAFVNNFQSLGMVKICDAERAEEMEKFGCTRLVPAKPYSLPIFSIPSGGTDGTFVPNEDFVRYYDAYTNSEIVSTETRNLNPDHVYAIITLPGRISPTIEARYWDGPLTALNNTSFKNLLTMDVVKGVLGFEKPAWKMGRLGKIECEEDIVQASSVFQLARLSDFANAYDAYKNILRGAALSNASITFSAPSPIYPDLIALPLMSKERCYGPWLSAAVENFDGDTRIRYSDIGGKVEFVKDENLAPWNYTGYQLMNEAGALRAQFSNSLLLYVERGGFVYPGAPTGIALARALEESGPLVTSVSVSIDSNKGISTTVKMDLYTSSFGKLQKQKEGAISNIVRDRQRIIDNTNANIRRGLGKGATNAGFSQMIKTAGGVLNDKEARLKELKNNFSDLERGQQRELQLFLSSSERDKRMIAEGESILTKSFNYVANFIGVDELSERDANFPTLPALMTGHVHSASESLAKFFTGAGKSPGAAKTKDANSNDNQIRTLNTPATPTPTYNDMNTA